ncbi:3-hydroxyacyl-CoA dehydrogenase NAD-binding domain-containing protein [Govanella unica]|uniref:3-hydroxyacyl-CoA dehydrogenase NAD-binding domain-containing protein n=1 Tax=Govanella unica TaxID=2975056 RepID=A0A9X3TXA0_9PROT|nr:3-hydroxyacyl-CoA dehydrogenase NAD-binding domain-containing protein [Govania unica]MDA5193438.1 3-hydroxyacyl-CoA dehydrogenase NAD-binding domain-containing protein [Govania unica]
MTSAVSYRKEGAIAILTADNPPVNALGHAVRDGLVTGIAQANEDPEVRAILIICAGRTFFAGADIREFGKPQVAPSLRDVHEAMTASGKLIVSAIHGTALGGGFETALASHYRCALPSAKVGLPEVNLGILPGAGGTQRLPRIAGVEKALEMITSGRPIGAAQAKAMGAIDVIVDGELLPAALDYVNRLVAEGAPLRRVSDLQIDAASLPDGFFDAARARLAKEKRGFLAPQKCVDAVEAAVTLPFAQGLLRERELFEDCMASTQSRAQRYAFFAEREAAQIPGLGKEVKARPVASVGVLGAGTMGGGIAMNFLNAGIPVTLVEVKAEALDRGIATIRKNYEATAAKGRIKPEDVAKRMALLTGALEKSALKDADLIIEAVFENMELKKSIFAELDAIAKPGAVLASNTSTLDVDEIAAATSRPGDVIGLHFFSPANVMRLLEIVRGANTKDDALVTALQVAKTIGKVGVVSGVCYGFIGNRMLEPYGREAELVALEGATPSQVDKALYDFGFAMGPFAMYDLAGLDVNHLVRESHRDKLPTNPNYYAIGDAVYKLGRYGQKTQAGIYTYTPGSRTPHPDPVIETLVQSEAARLGIAQRSFTDAEIVERCVYALINEGARLLAEGIAYRPGDIDQVWLNGYGFPVYRGGPMIYADIVGLDKVAAKIAEFRAQYGEEYWPHAPLLEKLAAAGKSFADWREVM